MNSPMPRYVQLGDWIFEVKAVKALRVPKYGEPYSGIANLSVIGDNMYIDGKLSKDGDEFSRSDFNTFYEFCRQMDMKACLYDRIKNGERKTRTVEITENVQPMPNIRLVK